MLGPWRGTELYLNYGRGFHSNDPRAATTVVDPLSGEPVESEDPLVPARGAEVGLRTVALPGLQSTVALWYLAFDSELIFDPAGDFIPGALDRVVAGALTVTPVRRVFGSVRLRHFGPRPLVEDASVRSAATTILNGEIGVRLNDRFDVVLEAFNLLNSDVSDIDYFYTSRLPGEPAGGVDDVHFHPSIPRTARVLLNVDF